MWLFTRIGFFSIVVDKRDPDTLLVRAREPSHLSAFCVACSPRIDLTRIKESPNNDYPWRVLATREEVGAFLAEHIATLGYSNFKGEVDKQDMRRPRDGGAMHRYANLLHDVWGVVRRALDKREYSMQGRPALPRHVTRR